MTSSVEKDRRRQRALFDLLGQYPAATTDQLATLLWGGDQRLARAHLLRYLRSGQLRRWPHPLYRNGAYVYSRSERSTSHSQKVVHHLALMDLHLAITRHLARHGARVIPEMPWGPGLVPDQTVLWRDAAWAVEHHLTGQFGHGPDYRRFMEEEQFEACPWWRDGMQLGLLALVAPIGLEPVRTQLRRAAPPGLIWRVVTRESALQDPGAALKVR